MATRPRRTPIAKTRLGHGRNGAHELAGPNRVSVRIGGTQPGTACPSCGIGMLYEVTKPGVMIRVVGQSPVPATIRQTFRLSSLIAWSTLIEQQLVEPNSGVGAAFAYLRRHWTKLTLFLRVPGAPLKNNMVERAHGTPYSTPHQSGECFFPDR